MLRRLAGSVAPAPPPLLSAENVEELRDQLAPRIVTSSGRLVNATHVAYDVAQQLVAVATSDGRVRLYGGDGEEWEQSSSSSTPTTQLLFAPFSSLLVRASAAELEVLDFSAWLQTALRWDCEVTALAASRHAPYLFVGDQKGLLSVVYINTLILRLEPTDYSLSPENLGLASATSVTCAVLQPQADDGRLLIGYAGGTILLVDLPERRAIAALVPPSDGAPVKLLSAAWVGTAGTTFIAAYESGEVSVCSLPSPVHPSRAAAEELQDIIVSRRIAVPGASGMRVVGTRPDSCFVLSGTRLFGVASLDSDPEIAIEAEVLSVVDASSGGEPLGLALREGGGLTVVSPNGTTERQVELCAVAAPPAMTAFSLHAASGKILAPLWAEWKPPAGDSCGILRGAETPLVAGIGPERMLISGHADGSVRIWDASNTTVCQLATLQAGGDAPVFCALPDLPIVAVCANGQLQLYTINDDCADGTFAALADPCGRIARIDLATGTATAIDVASDGSVIALCMVKFEQGAHVAALCNSSAAVLWPLEGAVPPVVVRPKTPSDGVAIIGLNGDGRLCDKDQEAEFIVTASSQALRLYAVQSMLSVSRTTVRKETLDLTIVAAAASVCEDLSLVVCLAPPAMLLVYTAATLQALSQVDLSLPRYARVQLGVVLNSLSCSVDGAAAALSATGELHRVALLEDAVDDWPQIQAPDVFSESTAAFAQERFEREASQKAAAAVPSATTPPTLDEGEQPTGLNKLRFGFKAMTGELRAKANELKQRVADKVERITQKESDIRKPLSPDQLRALFVTSKPAASSSRPPATTSSAASSSRAADEDRDVLELPRSADAIKEKYGRPGRTAQKQSADDVAATMAQNRDKLLERGEKLSRLEEKMSQMTADASDFAENARKLRERSEKGVFGGLF